MKTEIKPIFTVKKKRGKNKEAMVEISVFKSLSWSWFWECVREE